MSDRCLLCSLNPQTDSLLCWKHVDAFSDLLNPSNNGRPSEDVPASIPQLWAKLDPTPAAGGPDERRPPGFKSSPAASLHVLVMRDNRSRNSPQVWFDPHPSGVGEDFTRPHCEEENPPRPIQFSVQALLDSLIEDLELIGPRMANGRWFAHSEVLAICALLHDWRYDLITYHHVDEVYLDLLELSDQLRRAVGDAPLGPSGWCTELVRDRHTTAAYRECGGPLNLLPPERDDPVPPDETDQQKRKRKERDQGKEVARCPRCHRRYSWLDLIRIQYIDKPDAEIA
jgi:hypothetical protein